RRSSTARRRSRAATSRRTARRRPVSRPQWTQRSLRRPSWDRTRLPRGSLTGDDGSMTSQNDSPAGQNSISDGALGSLPTKVLVHGATAARAEVLVRAATVISWQAPWHGELAELMDGYVDEEDVLQQQGGRAAILFPFANRLRDDRYTFDGVTRDMALQYP